MPLGQLQLQSLFVVILLREALKWKPPFLSLWNYLLTTWRINRGRLLLVLKWWVAFREEINWIIYLPRRNRNVTVTTKVTEASVSRVWMQQRVLFSFSQSKRPKVGEQQFKSPILLVYHREGLAGWLLMSSGNKQKRIPRDCRSQWPENDEEEKNFLRMHLSRRGENEWREEWDVLSAFNFGLPPNWFHSHRWPQEEEEKKHTGRKNQKRGQFDAPYYPPQFDKVIPVVKRVSVQSPPRTVTNHQINALIPVIPEINWFGLRLCWSEKNQLFRSLRLDF